MAAIEQVNQAEAAPPPPPPEPADPVAAAPDPVRDAPGLPDVLHEAALPVGEPPLLAQANPQTNPQTAQPAAEPGELARVDVPGGGELSLRYGFDAADLKHRQSIDLGFSFRGENYGISIKRPSTTVDELAPEQGALPPSIDNPTVGVPDFLLKRFPYIGPIVTAIPGAKKEATVTGELREGQTPAGDPTNVAHVSVGVSTAPKSLDITKQVNEAVDATLEELPIPPDVEARIKEEIGDRIDLLLKAEGPDGKPLIGLKSELGAKVTLQFDVVVETAKGNPLDVRSLELYATIKGAVSASESANLPNLPAPLDKLNKGKADLSLESSASISVRYEAGEDTPPPQVIDPVDPGEAFVRLNQGDTRTAFNVTEELLQGVASLRFPDGSVKHGIPVSEGTSVWDLSRVADGRNHGHQSLDLANRVHDVLHDSGALAPGEWTRSTGEARAELAQAFAGADPAERAAMAERLANPLGLNFGIPEVARANEALAATSAPLATAAHFRDYF